ncbi:hypothetical protein SB861_14640 [Paraburkholderia sp. SIMBA_049]
MTSTPCLCWLTNGVKRQLESFAREQGMPAEAIAGELVTDRLRELGVPPAPDPVPPAPPAVLTNAMRERLRAPSTVPALDAGRSVEDAPLWLDDEADAPQARAARQRAKAGKAPRPDYQRDYRRRVKATEGEPS